jgi:hypothetical protein
MQTLEISTEEYRHSLFEILRALTGITKREEVEGRWDALSNDELLGIILATTSVSMKRLAYLERQRVDNLHLLETLRQLDLFRRD